MYGTMVPRSIWALNFDPTMWPMAPVSYYPKPPPEPTQTAGPSFATWSLLSKPFPSNKESDIQTHHPLHTRQCLSEHRYRAYLLEWEPVPRPISPHSIPT